MMNVCENLFSSTKQENKNEKVEVEKGEAENFTVKIEPFRLLDFYNIFILYKYCKLAKTCEFKVKLIHLS
jgi:hypothetical protein